MIASIAHNRCVVCKQSRFALWVLNQSGKKLVLHERVVLNRKAKQVRKSLHRRSFAKENPRKQIEKLLVCGQRGGEIDRRVHVLILKE